MRSILILTAFRVAFGMWVATSLWAAPVSFTTGSPDGRLGAASRRASPGKLETETADDFILQQTTVINRATITGLVPLGTPLANIKEVEVEVYHVFPLDSAPASGKVPSRANSPSDVEIGSRHTRRRFWNAHILRKCAECKLPCGQHSSERHQASYCCSRRRRSSDRRGG